MKRWTALVFLLCSACFAQATPVFVMEFSNPSLIPARWSLEIRPDGSGHFHSVRGDAPRVPGQMIEAANQDRDVRVSPLFAERIFDLARRKKLFQVDCESHLKVAFQGTKRLAYTGPDGVGACEFNYSKDPDIQNLGESLGSVATTLIEGARLQALLVHDRLGLDRETEVLAESAADGRALQIGSIRDILKQLADDDAVMERVRRRARALLARAED